MKPAAEKMREKINDTKFNKPSVPLIYNVTAKPIDQSSDIKTLLIKQIVSTVKWRESIINMSSLGVKNFIEIGPERF